MTTFFHANNFSFSYKNSSMKPFNISKGSFKNKLRQDILNLKNLKISGKRTALV